MPVTNRVALGHTLTAVGVLVRRASIPFALFAAVIVVLAGALSASPVELVWIVALSAAAFLVSRIFAVGLGAVGWMVFPPGHRTLLAELASHATIDG